MLLRKSQDFQRLLLLIHCFLMLQCLPSFQPHRRRIQGFLQRTQPVLPRIQQFLQRTRRFLRRIQQFLQRTRRFLLRIQQFLQRTRRFLQPDRQSLFLLQGRRRTSQRILPYILTQTQGILPRLPSQCLRKKRALPCFPLPSRSQSRAPDSPYPNQSQCRGGSA